MIINLSPYEHNRIIKDDFGKTEMGRDLLAEDYMLKQITSSLIYPEDGLGRKFWDKVYERAWKEYHTSNVPVNTFNKVWIVPDQALVYESGNTAYILQSHLKVMLEEDYLSLTRHSEGARNATESKGVLRSFAGAQDDMHTIGSQVIREIVLPELEQEVNEGKNFATLRQMYSGMILATWYKKALKESLLGKIYADKAKIRGVDQDPRTDEEIYQRYLKAFKKGVFNYIKEDVDKYTHTAIPRKYFSGGFMRGDQAMVYVNLSNIRPDQAQLIMRQNITDMDRAEVVLHEGNNNAAMLSSKIKRILSTTLIAAALANSHATGFAQKPQAPATGTTAPSKDKKVKKEVLPATILKIRALNGDREALEEIISWTRKDLPSAQTLPYARTLVSLSDYRLPAAMDVVKNDTFSQYFKMAEQGDLFALDFLETIFRKNRQVRNEIRSMDIQVLVRRTQLSPERGEENGWEARRQENLAYLSNFAKEYGHLNAIAALRTIDPTGIEDNFKALLADYGNSMAIVQLGSNYSINKDSMQEKQFDTGVLEGSIDNEKMKEINRAISIKIIDDQANILLRAYDFKDLINMALNGNETALYLVTQDLIDIMGYTKIADAWRNADLKDMKEGLKKGDYKIFRALMNLYNFGNPEATRELPITDISGLAAQAEMGNIDALDTLIDLEKYRHQQVARVLQFMKVDQIIEAFKKGDGTLRALHLLLILARDFYNQSVYNAFGDKELDFSKALGWGMGAPVDRLDFFFDIGDLANPLMGNFLSNGLDAESFFEMLRQYNEKDYSSDYFREAKSLYILTMIYNNPSARTLLLRLNSEKLSDDVKSGRLGFAELLDAQRTLQDKPKGDIEEMIRAGESYKKKVGENKVQEEKKQDEVKNDHVDKAMKGGIDFNSANLNLQIKRDGRGVPLPLLQQDWAQLNRIQGFVPEILDIKPATDISFLNELQQKFRLPSQTSSR